MTKKIIELLKLLWKTFLDELTKKFVRWITGLLLSFLVGLLVPQIRNGFYLPIWKLLTTPIIKSQLELGLIHLMLILLCMVALTYLGVFIKTRSLKKPKLKYFEFHGLHWRYNTHTQKVEFRPFCPEHKMQYIEYDDWDSMVGSVSYNKCPLNPPKTKLETISTSNLFPLHSAAESFIQSKLNKYQID